VDASGALTSCSLRRLQELADGGNEDASLERKRRRSRICEQLVRVPINVGITQGASSGRSGLAGQEGGGLLFAWFLTAFFSTPEHQTPSSPTE
jgi:hypothetical protein